MKPKDVVTYVVIGVAGYFLYQWLKKAGGAVDSALDTITKPIANAYVALTSPAAPVPQGSVILPDLSSFPMANLTNLGFGFKPGASAPTFKYNGVEYYLAPHDQNGNYQATPV